MPFNTEITLHIIQDVYYYDIHTSVVVAVAECLEYSFSFLERFCFAFDKVLLSKNGINCSLLLSPDGAEGAVLTSGCAQAVSCPVSSLLVAAVVVAVVAAVVAAALPVLTGSDMEKVETFSLICVVVFGRSGTSFCP